MPRPRTPVTATRRVSFRPAVALGANAAEAAMKEAKTDIDFARAQGEFATMAAQIAALRKYRKQ